MLLVVQSAPARVGRRGLQLFLHTNALRLRTESARDVRMIGTAPRRERAQPNLPWQRKTEVPLQAYCRLPSPARQEFVARPATCDLIPLPWLPRRRPHCRKQRPSRMPASNLSSISHLAKGCRLDCRWDFVVTVRPQRGLRTLGVPRPASAKRSDRVFE